MNVQVLQKTITMSPETKRNLDDMMALAKLEGVELPESAMFGWALDTLKSSLVDMKNNGLKLKPIFIDAIKFRKRKLKKNKYLED